MGTIKKYATLSVLIIILLVITLYSAYYIDNDKYSITAGDKFYRILFSEEELEPSFQEEHSNWENSTKLEYAHRSITNSMLPQAISTYNSLANDEKAPNVLRELAQYLEVMNLIYSDNSEIGGEKISNLELSIVYPYSSKEAIAITKIRNNDIKGAAEVLHSLLRDSKCPTLIKANAQELLQVLEARLSTM